MDSILDKKNILYNEKINNVEALYNYLQNIFIKHNISNNGEQTISALKEREKINSTGFEKGIAIPHARDKSIKKPTLIFLKLKNSIEWNAMDGKKTNIFFIILFPNEDQSNINHLDLLALLAQNLLDNEFIKLIQNNFDKEKIMNLLNERLFNNKLMNNNETKVIEKPNENFYVAIVACTFGLAHTYLAEQKLIKYAKENNFNIKVETYGKRGNLNKITNEDLANAKGVLIAIDKDVDISHIKHNNILKVSTGYSIHNTAKCFDILNGKLKVSKSKQKLNNFFNIHLRQASMFSIGKTYNYLSKISIIIGIFIFLNQFQITLNFSTQILNIAKYASFVVMPILTGLFIYFFTKSEGSASTTAITLFILQFYFNKNNFIENKNLESIGLIGILFYSLLTIFYHKYIYSFINFIFKKNKLNGLLKFIFQILLVPIMAIIIYFTFTYISFVTNNFYFFAYQWSEKYWWFNIIIATLFFGLMVTDMGGPINKWTIIISCLIFLDSFSINIKQIWLIPITSQVVAITIPGISTWVRGIFFKNFISKEEYIKCMKAGKYSMKGISEEALWVIKDYRWWGYIWIYTMAFISGFIIGFFKINLYGGSNTILGVIFGFSTDNVLTHFGLNYYSINIGYLILMVLTPLISGILSIIFLNKKTIRKEN